MASLTLFNVSCRGIGEKTTNPGHRPLGRHSGFVDINLIYMTIYKTYKSYSAFAFSAGELLAEVYLFGLVADNLDVYTIGGVGYAYP